MRAVMGFAFAFVALVFVSNGNAADINAVASAAAGKPIQVRCDADRNLPPGLRVPGTVVHGWSQIPSNEIHLHPARCQDLLLGPQTVQIGADDKFSFGLQVLLHESRHAAGVVSEGCAELYAQLASFDILRRFYGIPFFTPTSWIVGGNMEQRNRKLAGHYRALPNSCLGEKL